MAHEIRERDRAPFGPRADSFLSEELGKVGLRLGVRIDAGVEDVAARGRALERDLEDPAVRSRHGARHTRPIRRRRQPSHNRFSGRDAVQLNEGLRSVRSPVRAPRKAAGIEEIIEIADRAPFEPHLDSISQGPDLLDSRVDAFRANMLFEHPDQLGRVEVIANQSRRLEAVDELRPFVSPSLEAKALLEGRTAACCKNRKVEPGDLLEPRRETGGRALANADGRNAGVEHMQQFGLRQITRQMRGGYEPGRAAAQYSDFHAYRNSVRLSAGRNM